MYVPHLSQWQPGRINSNGRTSARCIDCPDREHRLKNYSPEPFFHLDSWNARVGVVFIFK